MLSWPQHARGHPTMPLLQALPQGPRGRHGPSFLQASKDTENARSLSTLPGMSVTGVCERSPRVTVTSWRPALPSLWGWRGCHQLGLNLRPTSSTVQQDQMLPGADSW